jgi:2-methylcitrate dehydratase PrpD
MIQTPISRKIAGFVTALSFESLPESGIHQLKTFFLDWLASAYAGSGQRPVTLIRDVIQTMGGTPEAVMIPGNTRTNCLFAALANGASSHMVEMDDLHRESILHPAAAVIPAVFAAAQREHASGKELLTAVAAGYETAIRIAAAAGPGHYRHWHTTGTCGTFGAAAGSAKILHLNEEEFAWAMGSAGTQASGLWEFLAENAMSKQLHAGKAAFNGLLAALLSQKGFTGATTILEGEKGFFHATSPEFNIGKCTAGLGESFMFMKNSLKYYASCGHTHSAIEATLQALSGEGYKTGDIEAIHVRIYQAALDLLGNIKPHTPFGAKFNLPFCVATAAKFRQAGLDDFTAVRLNDSDIGTLMKRIILESDEALSRDYPRKWPAQVEIRLNDGRLLQGRVDYPKGDPENPLSREELLHKFKTLTRDILDPHFADVLMDRIMNLEKEPDVSLLLKKSP